MHHRRQVVLYLLHRLRDSFFLDLALRFADWAADHAQARPAPRAPRPRPHPSTTSDADTPAMCDAAHPALASHHAHPFLPPSQRAALAAWRRLRAWPQARVERALLHDPAP